LRDRNTRMYRPVVVAEIYCTTTLPGIVGSFSVVPAIPGIPIAINLPGC
jgi:hypothetical protein